MSRKVTALLLCCVLLVGVLGGCAEKEVAPTFGNIKYEFPYPTEQSTAVATPDGIKDNEFLKELNFIEDTTPVIKPETVEAGERTPGKPYAVDVKYDDGTGVCVAIYNVAEDFDACINVNLKGSFNMIKHLSRSFLKQKSGSIVNVSSVVGLMGNAGQINYASSKAGVVGLTKSVAKEFASRGITCNAVAPGYIETDMTAVLSEETKEMFLKQIPLGRAGKPSDVANTVKFLVSDAASYLTGQVIKIDGGMYI